ncbi:MAG: hypothetical protein DRH93_01165 [Deltaproteobacteria bacterium]|nr:MAG: hypothetical protein DRH93_01165 [Deltaproteobacteria bacterium]
MRIEVNMRIKIIITCLLSATLLLNWVPCFAEESKNEDTLALVSDYTYKIGSIDSQEKYESLCLFGAKYKAVVLSAKYLNHIGLLKNYGKKQKEIFCLAASELKFSIIEKRLIEKENSYYIKIKTTIKSTDFIKGEIKNIKLEEEEKHFSWQEEMGQNVYRKIDPGQELSRAYRYFRKRDWRIAIIYLDHLEKKYPNWHEVYFAKAIGFYATNNIKAMMTALKISCSLGNREACEDIEGLLQYDESLKIYND